MGKKKTNSVVDEATEKDAGKGTLVQHRQRNVNLYRAMERLLRNYKRFRQIVDHPDEFDFFPQGKSKSISIAPPAGSGVVDKVDLAETYIDARKKAFEAILVNWIMADMAISLFKDHEEFRVIRMYYFNEDSDGNDRLVDTYYTFEDIASELAEKGIDRGEKTLRTWRTKLVQDMTVVLFGIEGALSVEAREPKQGVFDRRVESNGES